MMWPPTLNDKSQHAHRSNRLTISLSVAAFILSAFAFYTTSLRVVDDIRVIAGEMPFAEPDFEAKKFEIHGNRSRYVFINSGNRGAIISGITLKVAQPTERFSLPDTGCNMPMAEIISYDVEAFLLKPGDLLTKGAALAIDTSTKKSRASDSSKASPTVAFSDLNAKSKKVSFRMCIDVIFTTPSIELAVKTINEFEDELDETVMGYLVTAPDKIVERRPVQLIKRNGIVFFD
jgi:hypothetical protein